MDDRIITALGAVIGVPLILGGYIWLTEQLLSRLPRRTQPTLRPYVWVFPAVAFAFVFMVLPAINTVILSFLDRRGTTFVGLDNYTFFFTNPDTLGSLKNTILWLIFFTGFSVLGGLLTAILFDRIRYESLAKAAVFLPIPISAVASSIIWKFMYQYDPPGLPQTGTLNALIGTFGFDPVAWLVESSTNNAALIFVGIWTATGFAMTIISASLKSIAPELLEAARVDGANELRVLWTIVVPLLLPTLTVVGTTLTIQALRVFDIPYVLTSGAFDTDVIASQMFTRLNNGQYDRASAVAVVLLIAVIPLMLLNIRRFRQQEEIR
jgi:alpha-glucoside transport system permease protein